jgi:hypothetical protein
MPSFDLKLTLSRSQRRLLDGLARPSGLKTGPWARSQLLAMAAPAAPPPQGAPAAPKPPLPATIWICPHCHTHGSPTSHTCARVGSPSRPIRTPAEVKAALTRSFEPDTQS